MAAKKDVTLLHTAKQGDETHFYIFNKADGGWVIVGGDEVCHDIIAFSETGTFDYDNAPSNLRNWLSGYEAEISHAIAATTDGGVRKAVKKTAVTTSAGETIEAMIKTHWDQSEPYWNMCPDDSKGRCYTGCVATAMAQVMYFWQWPKVGVESKSYYDSYGCKKTLSTTFSDHYYDWDNMQLETSGYTTTAQKNAVAQLMYDCGVSVEMQYSSDGSGAYSNYIPVALNSYFSYQNTMSYVLKRNYKETDWVNLIYAELAAGRPVLYSGADGDAENAGGHQFICDGYQFVSNTHKFHFNFGWSGQDDGFYDLESVGKEPGYMFPYQQDAVIGIQPEEISIYSVTLADNGVELKPSVAGSSVTLPTRDEIVGYTFIGWADNGGLTEATTTKPTILPTKYTPTKDVTLYPVYSYIQPGEGSGVVELLSEYFDSATKGSNTSKDSVGKTIWEGNSNFTVEGKVYEAKGALKFSSGDGSGKIISKKLTEVTAGLHVNVEFKVKGWLKYEGPVSVQLTDCDEQKITYNALLSSPFETKTVSFTAVSSSPQVSISFASGQRGFIDDVIITAGSGSLGKTYYTTWGTYSDAMMKITSAKWATFYAPYDVELEGDIYAYAVTADDTDIQRVYVADGNSETTNVIPAHTPVIVYKDIAETYTKTYHDSFSTIPSSFSENCLVGAITAISQLPATTGANTNYVLQLDSNSKPAWFSVIYDETNEKYNSLAANRAYLSIPTDASVKGLFDEATAIDVTYTSENDWGKAPVYNLQGQVVNGSFHGIVIRNGHKFLLK